MNMKRSLQEVIELVGFALIAFFLGILLLWVSGWLIKWLGIALQFIAAFLLDVFWWVLLIAIIGIAIYALIKMAQNRDRSTTAASAAVGPQPSAPAAPSVHPAPSQPLNSPRAQTTAPRAEQKVEPRVDVVESEPAENTERTLRNEIRSDARRESGESGGTETAGPSEGFHEMVEDEREVEDEQGNDKKS